jgi:hypothetical protein
MRNKPTATASKKKLKRKTKEHEGESDDAGGVELTPKKKSKAMAEVPIEEANKASVPYCAVDSFGADGAVMMVT